MAEALEDADADGTRSILDLDRVADQPDFGAATRWEHDTASPVRYDAADPRDGRIQRSLWEDLERGQGIYIVLYRDDQPDEIYFAGYSLD